MVNCVITIRVFWKKKSKQPPKLETRGTSNKYFFKLALLGDGAVGKTNLRRQYLGQGFTSDHLMTIGADFAAHDIALKHQGEEYQITMQIWDLAGQETFSAVRSKYYRGCFGGLVIFDRTRPVSFDNITSWIDELVKHSTRGLVPIVILGNKSDLVDSADNVVKEKKVMAYVDKINEENADIGFKINYYDTSALTGLNVDDAFTTLGTEILSWILSKK